jgi:O-antigen/teichoic acid export membrane protein
VVNRITGALTTLAITGIAASRLNVSELAVFLLTAGLLAVGVLADFGVPNAVVSPLAAALTHADVAAAKGFVTEALRRLIRIAVCVALVGVLVSVAATTIGRETVVPEAVNDGDMRTALVTLTLCVAVGLPGSLFVRVLLGAGHAIAAAVSGIVAQVVIVALAIVAWLTEASLPFFVALTSCSTLLTGAFAYLALRQLEPVLAPRLGDRLGPTRSRQLRGSAALFVGIGFAGFVGFETDGFVIAGVLGSQEAPGFLVPARFLLLVPTLAGVYLAPVWPQITVAAEDGDLRAIRRRFDELLTRVALVGALMTACGGLLVIPMMNIIVPSVDAPDAVLLAALCAVAFVHTLSVPYAIVLSGLGLLRAQFLSAVAMATANLALSIALASWIGVVGPAIATVVCQMLLTLLPLTIVINRRLAPSNDV